MIPRRGVIQVETPEDLIARVESAVRNLVQLIRRHGDESMSVAPGGLLDVWVDGVRCRLETAATSTEGSTGRATGGAVGGAGGVSPLSRRETEVARMVAQGYPNKAIAARLEISSFTVASYIRRIFAKLNVNSRAAMVARLLEDS